MTCGTKDRPRICYSYMRFSRAEQRQGSSTKRQTELRDAYCQRHGLVLDDSRMYSDEGVSGYFGKNAIEGHLGELLSLIRAGEIAPDSVLLVESMDRLSRDQIRPARNLFESILEAGIEIRTLQPERIYNRESLTDLYALFEMLVGFAKSHEYSVQLGTRLSAAWAGKREKAKNQGTPLTKRPPAWLKVVNGQYEVIEERAEVVRLIFELCVDQGMGVKLITAELTRRQIPPFYANTWSETYVAKILMGQAVLGHHQPNRVDHTTKKPIPTEKILNLFPPVIDETLYARARVAMRDRRCRGGRISRTKGPTNLFSGLLQSHQGSQIHVKYRRNSRKDNFMVAMLKDLETGRTYPLEHFTRVFLQWLANSDIQLLTDNKRENHQVKTLSDQLDKLAYKVQTLKDRIASGDQFESFLNLLSDAEREKLEATRRLEELQSRTPMAKGLSEFHNLLMQAAWDPIQNKLCEPVQSLITRESAFKLKAALRRLVSRIQLSIGDEHRVWQGKSLRVSVTFRDGTVKEFKHLPE